MNPPAQPRTAWIGVDLDGTLAHYDRWRGPDHIGAPIEPMMARVRAWLARGQHEVRIFTARANPANPDVLVARRAIEAWCRRHLGQVLPVTCEKDMMMVQLWDDRCVQVVANTGRRADGATD